MSAQDACKHARTLRATDLTPAVCFDCGVLLLTAEYLAALDERNARALSASHASTSSAPKFGSESATTSRKRGRA